MKWFSVIHSEGAAQVHIGSEIGCFNSGADDLLAEIGTAKDIHLVIDSMGGDARTGTDLYHALRGRVSTCDVVGTCGSTGVTIALTATRIRIVPEGRFLIHAPSSAVLGTAGDLRQSADYLDRLSAEWLDVISKRSSPELALAWLSNGDTWLNAEEAMASGLVDEIITPRARVGKPSKAAAAAISANETKPGFTESEEMVLALLRAVGTVESKDRNRLGREVGQWFATNVRQI